MFSLPKDFSYSKGQPYFVATVVEKSGYPQKHWAFSCKSGTDEGVLRGLLEGLQKRKKWSTPFATPEWHNVKNRIDAKDLAKHPNVIEGSSMYRQAVRAAMELLSDSTSGGRDIMRQIFYKEHGGVPSDQPAGGGFGEVKRFQKKQDIGADPEKFDVMQQQVKHPPSVIT